MTPPTLLPSPACVLENGRLRLRLELPGSTRAPHVVGDAPSSTRPAPHFLEIKTGSAIHKFPYYKTRWKKYTSYTLTWNDGRRRRREKRTRLAALKRRAEEIAKALVNGETSMLSFGQADRASWLRCRELAQSIGAPLEILVAEAVEARKKKSQSKILDKTGPQLVEDFLATRSYCPKWKRVFTGMTGTFAEHFPGPVRLLTAAEVQPWLKQLKTRHGKPVRLRTRRNYFDMLKDLFAYARNFGHAEKDWNPLAGVPNPEPPSAEVIPYTPDELVKILNTAESYAAGKKLLPLICITAFSKIRHGEMNEEGKLNKLDWQNLNFELRLMIVRKAVAKTGRDRVVKMTEQLADWLKPYARASGPVCEVKNTSSALYRLLQKAGVKSRKNGLRKSAATYDQALKNDLAAVAKEGGNSARVMQSNYIGVEFEYFEAAQRWYSLRPNRADILPLWDLAKTRKEKPF